MRGGRIFYAERFRFSLRVLFISVTLVACLIGTFGLRLARAKAQRDAVVKLKSFGARFYYDYHYNGRSGPWPVAVPDDGWMKSLLGIDFFHDTVSVTMNGGSYSADQFRQLTRLRSCKRLHLSNHAQVTIAAFGQLQLVHGLESISVETEAITDSHLAELSTARNLTTVGLDYCPTITDAGLRHLATMRQLQGLRVASHHLSDAGVSHLGTLNRLRWLSVHAPGVTDAAMHHLQGLADLERLNLSLTQISDNGIEQLRGLKKLQSVVLVHTNVSDAAVSHLVNLPALRQLDLTGTHVTDVGVKLLTRCATLEEVNLDDSVVKGAGAETLRAAGVSVY